MKTQPGLLNLVPSISAHCQQRLRERSILYDHLEMTCLYGSRHYIPRARAIYMRWRDIPDGVPDDQARKVHGLVVIMTQDGLIKTAYRNAKFLRKLRRLPRWS